MCKLSSQQSLNNILVILGWMMFNLAQVSGEDRCAATQMAKCTDPLTLVTENTDLGWGSSKQDIDEMCPKLMDGLACINSFTVRYF